MKKGLLAGIGLLVVLLIGFFWLVGGASADNAPQDVKTIDVDNNAPR